jgi:hypothetical protein
MVFCLSPISTCEICYNTAVKVASSEAHNKERGMGTFPAAPAAQSTKPKCPGRDFDFLPLYDFYMDGNAV